MGAASVPVLCRGRRLLPHSMLALAGIPRTHWMTLDGLRPLQVQILPVIKRWVVHPAHGYWSRRGHERDAAPSGPTLS